MGSLRSKFPLFPCVHCHRLGNTLESTLASGEVPTQNLKVKFILLMDMATHYRVTEVLASYAFGETYVETSNDVIKCLISRWLMDKPRPKILIPDNANTLISQQVIELMADLGIAVMPPPDNESWAHGVVERNIGHLKEAASRIHKSTPDMEPWTCHCFGDCCLELNRVCSRIQ